MTKKGFEGINTYGPIDQTQRSSKPVNNIKPAKKKIHVGMKNNILRFDFVISVATKISRDNSNIFGLYYALKKVKETRSPIKIIREPTIILTAKWS